MYRTKAASQSVGVVAQLVAILILGLKMAGIDISADVAGLTDHVGTLVDAGALLTAQVIALYGRLRADTKINSVFKPKK